MRAVTSRHARSVATIRAGAFRLGLVAASLLSAPAAAQDLAVPDSSSTVYARHADFAGQSAPDSVEKLADWIVDSRDNQDLPFVILNKPLARVFVFDKDGHMSGTASVLVGLTPGDDSIPGIGTMPLTAIHPDMRTTPAGRFVSALGHDLGKLDVLWVDYHDAISLHRVINTDPSERRLERIVSSKPSEHRISYGCINVPAKFFDTVVDPAFQHSNGIVYILPEIKTVQEVFPHYYDVDAPRTTMAADVQAPDAGAVPTIATATSEH